MSTGMSTGMSAAVRLGLRLALGSGRERRLRTLSVTLAVLIGSVVLLATAAIARSQELQQPWVYDAPENRRLLAAVVASVLFPVLVLAATVGRLSAGLRDRRMANLRLLGMGAAAVRLVAAVETGVAALAGALLGALGFLVVRQPLAGVRVAGVGWPAYTLWPPVWVYAAVVVLLPAVVVAVGIAPQRLRMADALALAHRADSRRPGWWRVGPLALGVVLCLYAMAADRRHGLPDSVVAALFAGIALVGVGLILVVPVFVRLLADLTLRLTTRPTLTVAARRLQAQPAGVTRVIGGLLVGLFLVVGARAVVVAFESTPQYERAADQVEHAQTAAGTVVAARAADAVRRVREIHGIRAVESLPTLASPCRSERDFDRGCVRAVVATCAQLRALAPGLRGCVPGRPLVLENTWGVGVATASLLPLHPVRHDRVVEGSAGVRVPADAARLTGDPSEAVDGDLGWRLEPLQAQLVLPADLPGLSPLVSRTDRTVVAVAGPGRWLGDQLAGVGADGMFAGDFTDYDFVGQLRALVWAVAAVILSIGLLAFAVAAVDRAVTRRREVTSLQLVGVPRSVLRRTQWVEAAVPLAFGCVLAVALGLLAGGTYLSLDSGSLGVPWPQSLVLAALAALGAVLVGALTVVASSPRLSPSLVRAE